MILFEATGIYSYPLKAFCAIHMIKAYIINPQTSHSFAKSLGTRSKTDTIDARTIWEYHKIIGDKDISIPRVYREIMTLGSYLASYRLTLKQQLALANQKVAVIAAMRKLLLLAHAVYKNKTVYVPG